jgi:replication initiation and membrane attachment protein DnaB
MSATHFFSTNMLVIFLLNDCGNWHYQELLSMVRKAMVTSHLSSIFQMSRRSSLSNNQTNFFVFKNKRCAINKAFPISSMDNYISIYNKHLNKKVINIIGTHIYKKKTSFGNISNRTHIFVLP